VGGTQSGGNDGAGATIREPSEDTSTHSFSVDVCALNAGEKGN